MNLYRYVLYLCGQLGLMTLLRFFFTWMVRYCEQPVVGAPKGETSSLVDVIWVGYVLLAFRLFDGVTDPIAGAISDKWRQGGRERRQLLWFAFLVPPIGLALSFAASLDVAVAMRWGLLVTGMFVFFVGYTFYAIPYWSLIDDYGQDEDQRRKLSNLLGVGMLGATALGTVVSGPVIDALGFTQAAFVFAGPCAVLMILPYFGQPPSGPVDPLAKEAGGQEEGGKGAQDQTAVVGEALDPAEDTQSPEEETPGLIAGFFSALKHRRFLATLFLFAGSQMSFTVLTTSTVFMVEHLLKSASPEKDNGLVMACFLATSFLAFAAVPYLSRRFGWEKSVIAASCLLGGVYVMTGLLGQGVIGSPMVTACIIFALGGPMASVLLGLEGEAITDCARERGGNVTSMYFGVFNLVVKGLNGVAIAITTQLVVNLKPENIGPSAARYMGPTAGALLVLGVGVYFFLRPRGALAPSKA
jgi:Na+/melibiose symporter-like transporter